ncbi:MAG: formylglycine-generating enzyme family protein, partial [bacterium]
QVENQKSRIGKGQFRLPTEAEWEYACRAGTKTAYCFGNDDDNLCRYGNYREKSSGLPVGGKLWEKTDLEHDDGFKTTAPVGRYRPNAWGLYDMHGNVWEWCQDYYGEDYAARAAKDPTGAASGSARVFRGGGWFSDAGGCRSANRYSFDPRSRNGDIGFRLSRTLP